MELRLSLTPKSSTPSSFSAPLGYCCKPCHFHFQPRKKRMSIDGARLSVKASAEPSSERIEQGDTRGGFTTPAMEVTTMNRSFNDVDFPVWDKIGAVVRLGYGIGIYGTMVLAGRFICSINGIDSMGGFELSLDAILEGLGYAVPPIMALLFILDDEVVKLSPHARAIRDAEDEELRSFFYGMSPWQFILMVAASSVGEELFYRAAVQMNVSSY
ncbi:hypothetical protein L6164_019758 [Bauhinia variegata]|uniref:Uncharacterized protein n=1 Tax=Bauhinia variegata TaxID=167791 RepID=A0ACB9MT39_BAUVA|nr:hypothetical protein L6164_019758 [Bauhinia variegata]